MRSTQNACSHLMEPLDICVCVCVCVFGLTQMSSLDDSSESSSLELPLTVSWAELLLCPCVPSILSISFPFFFLFSSKLYFIFFLYFY